MREVASALEGWTTAIVVSLVSGEVLPPQIDAELHVATYAVLADDPAELVYCDSLSTPLSTIVVTVAQGILPETESGIINPGPPPTTEFLRGDANAEGSFSGLVDGLFMLNFQFVPGSPVPPCMDAADFDDDGSFSGLVDGLAALNCPWKRSPPSSGICKLRGRSVGGQPGLRPVRSVSVDSSNRSFLLAPRE